MLAVLVFATAIVSVAQACGPNQYAIQSGDTFANLAQEYSGQIGGYPGNVNALTCQWLNANPGVNPCLLQVGQCVNLPAPSASAYCPNGVIPSCNNGVLTGYYGGYTAPSYAYSSGSWWYPTAYNGAGGYYTPWSGYPSGYSGCSCINYSIVSGDTFYNMCTRCGNSLYTSGSAASNPCLEAIEACNPTVNPNQLSIGQPICIPNGYACVTGKK